MSSKKSAKPAKKQPEKQAAKARGRCRVCGNQVVLKVTVVKGLEQYHGPENCPTCGRKLQFDVLGPA